MDQLTHWLPTLTTAAVVVGVAFVADSSIKRHENVLTSLVEKVHKLSEEVAVLKALAGVKD